MTSKKNQKTINGVFILDKPVGLSSNQALQKVRRIFQAKKAGHTGSLDVLASGLLPICFGEATKFSQYLLDADKTYNTVAELGKRTTTCDAEGEVVEEKPIDHINLDLVNQTLAKFTGEIEQIPSMFSALKHNGQPLYKLARKGIEVERKKRRITIYKIELISFTNNLLELKVHCSKGTYIRNLVDDIGQALESAAYVKSLRRLSSGPFEESQMRSFDSISEADDAKEQYLLPMNTLLTQFEVITLPDDQLSKLRCGQKVLLPGERSLGIYQLQTLSNELVGLVEQLPDNLLRSKRLLSC